MAETTEQAAICEKYGAGTALSDKRFFLSTMRMITAHQRLGAGPAKTDLAIQAPGAALMGTDDARLQHPSSCRYSLRQTARFITLNVGSLEVRHPVIMPQQMPLCPTRKWFDRKNNFLVCFSAVIVEASHLRSLARLSAGRILERLAKRMAGNRPFFLRTAVGVKPIAAQGPCREAPCDPVLPPALPEVTEQPPLLEAFHISNARTRKKPSCATVLRPLMRAASPDYSWFRSCPCAPYSYARRARLSPALPVWTEGRLGVNQSISVMRFAANRGTNKPFRTSPAL